MNNCISISHLKKSYGGQKVFNDFNLKIEEKKITAVFGPNGSGKSTLFNILSGITIFDEGKYFIKNSNLSYIFQNYRESLLPWRTIHENIALPLQIQAKNINLIMSRIKELEDIFQFSVSKEIYPYELSGGQQQIVAFMRALITRPEVLFIDEPFSALDYENNLNLRKHLQDYYLKYRPTIVLITHNIEEAVHLAHKVIVFSKKPTQVVKTIENNMKHPRHLNALKSEDFHVIKDKVLTAFQSTL